MVIDDTTDGRAQSAGFLLPWYALTNCLHENAGPTSPHNPPSRPVIDSLWGDGWVTVRPIQEATARSELYPMYQASLKSVVVPDLAAIAIPIDGCTAPLRMSVSR